MDRNELRTLLNNIRNERFMAKIIDEVDKARRATGIKDLGWFDFVEQEILKHHGVKPQLSIVSSKEVSPTKRILLDQFLTLAYQAFLEGAFSHRNDIDMFEAYCSPMSDKYGKYLDEMSIQQRKVIAMMNEDMIAHKRRKSMPYEDGTIERALDNVIKAKVKESDKE